MTSGKFAEPFRTTTLTAKSTLEGLNLESCSWTLEQVLEDSETDLSEGYYAQGLQDQYKSFDGVGEVRFRARARVRLSRTRVSRVRLRSPPLGTHTHTRTRPETNNRSRLNSRRRASTTWR